MRRWRSRRVAALGGAAAAGALLLSLAWIIPLPERLLAAPSTVVTYRDASPAHVFLSPDEKYRFHTPLERIDPDYLAALLRYEDKRFYRHPGVDPIAVLRSTAINLRHRQVRSGASTITTQLVRVLEPRPRTVRSKIVEALRAAQLELRLGKREILEAYLSFIPFGRNLEGIEAACYSYFSHGPSKLTLDEIAILLAVPQQPSARRPSPANRARLARARDEIAAWLIERGMLPFGQAGGTLGPKELLGQVRRSPVPEEMLPLPREAPHAAFWLRSRHPQHSLIRTTLDRGVQRQAAQLLAEDGSRLAPLGIHNGAVVVVKRHSAEVLALVGNPEFWDAAHGGQIPAFDVPRSPGSALKPLIYALAIDRGLALPQQLVANIPVRYGAYAPENYDGRFTGLATLEDALSESLNIPFVELLSRLGVERFVATLRHAGVHSLENAPGYYGLSAAIGSVELTPLELAGLYGMLADGGTYRPLRWIDDLAGADSAGARVQLLSPGAAWLTRRALRRRDRPDFPGRELFSRRSSAVHWKTGTSYGHHDAWAAGSDEDHTVVVWLGNLDYTPSVDLVGSSAAGPLLFDLLEGLRDLRPPAPPDRAPEDLLPVEVCAYSGYLPGDACGDREEVLAPRSRVPSTICPFHRALDVDLDTGLALNPSCRSARRYARQSFLVWPARVRRWLGRQHRRLPSPPSLDPLCQPASRHRSPTILSPVAGEVVLLVPGLAAGAQELPLEGESHAAETRLSWFLDGEFLGHSDDGQPLWWTPRSGRHEVVASDRSGRSARRVFEVRGGSSRVD